MREPPPPVSQEETLQRLRQENEQLRDQVDELFEDLDRQRQLLDKISDKYQREVQAEREKLDALLKRILPATIADELSGQGRVRPRRHHSVSVMFMDIKKFTLIAENLDPEALVQGLDFVFKQFDQITKRYRLEKIKTIGDAYMVAGGIPEPDRLHPVNCILAGLDIQRTMRKPATQRRLLALRRRDVGIPAYEWHLRLGIHTGGPVVASVIGDSKFAYDLWGDAVVTASRIESQGGPDEVNISEATHALVADLFDCTDRGEVPLKNKAPMKMYFVQGIRPALSQRGEGIQPTAQFWKLAHRRLAGQ